MKTREKEINYYKYTFWIRFANQIIYVVGQLLIVALIYWSVVLLGGQLSLDGVFVGVSVVFYSISFLNCSVSFCVEILGSTLSASKRITETLLLA